MAAPVTNAVVICNSALLKLGADKISSLSGTTRAAIVCNTLYEYLRDEVMGATPWRFAIKRVVLSPNGTPPAYTFAYTYDIPPDCLRLLVPDDDKIAWVQEGQTILSDEATMSFRYIYRNDDESSWDARFCEALAWRLAMELALALTQSIPMKQECEKSYKAALAEARSMNAVIGSGGRLEPDTWSDARRSSSWRATVGQLT